MNPASLTRSALNPSFFYKKSKEVLFKSLPSIPTVAPKTTYTSLKGRVKQLGTSIIDFLNDSLLVSIVLYGTGFFSKIAELSHHKVGASVPYLSLAISPFHLYHSFREVYSRSKFTLQAARAGQYSEASFLAGATLASLEGAIGSISSALAGTTEIAGLSSKVPHLDAVLTSVVPILATIAGSLRALIEGWRLRRSLNNLSELNELIDAAKGDINKIEELLSFIKDAENEGSDQKSKIKRECFVNNHFTSSKRFEELKKAIEDIGDTLTLEAGDKVLRLAKSDHHRQVLYHAIALTIALLSITAGILYLTSPQSQILAMSLWSAGAVLDIALVVFNKKVSMERYADLEDWIMERLNEIPKMPSSLTQWSPESYGPHQMNTFLP